MQNLGLYSFSGKLTNIKKQSNQTSMNRQTTMLRRFFANNESLTRAMAQKDIRLGRLNIQKNIHFEKNRLITLWRELFKK